MTQESPYRVNAKLESKEPEIEVVQASINLVTDYGTFESTKLTGKWIPPYKYLRHARHGDLMLVCEENYIEDVYSAVRDYIGRCVKEGFFIMPNFDDAESFILIGVVKEVYVKYSKVFVGRSMPTFSSQSGYEFISFI